MAYRLSPRITSTTTVYYNHSVGEGTLTQSTPGSSGISLDMSVNFLYEISLRFKFHLDYARTAVTSSAFAPGSHRTMRGIATLSGLSYTY